jgi:hypothetical protein
MARWSFVSVFVRLSAATLFSGSAGTATGDSATAAKPAVPRPGAGSVAGPMRGTSEARKDGSIIATANADTAVVAPA